MIKENINFSNSHKLQNDGRNGDFTIHFLFLHFVTSITARRDFDWLWLRLPIALSVMIHNHAGNRLSCRSWSTRARNDLPGATFGPCGRATSVLSNANTMSRSSQTRNKNSDRLGLLIPTSRAPAIIRTLAFVGIATTLLLQATLAYVSVDFPQLRIAFLVGPNLATLTASASKL